MTNLLLQVFGDLKIKDAEKLDIYIKQLFVR